MWAYDCGALEMLCYVERVTNVVSAPACCWHGEIDTVVDDGWTDGSRLMGVQWRGFCFASALPQQLEQRYVRSFTQ